jgi:hypothetical protein
MDPIRERLEEEIDRIENGDMPPPIGPGEPVEVVVDGLWDYYREQLPSERPLWLLVKDMQRQAMVYMNIIDQLKSGEDPTHIRMRFEELELVPENTLPNPFGLSLLHRALDKVTRYREALLDIVKRHGRTLVFDNLDFPQELTPSVALEIGFPPAVSIGVEFSWDRSDSPEGVE